MHCNLVYKQWKIMRAKQDLNYLCKLKTHGDSEIALWIHPTTRIFNFLSTKTPAEQQTAKEKLLQLLQEPPIKKFDESDAQYILRYTEWDSETKKYEWLMEYIK